MAGALQIIQENARREATGDDKFYKKLLYFFELRIPQEISAATHGSYFFPLVLNPKSYKLNEPFALERTFTQGGGLYIEEHGIIERTIMLEGTTGFKPRKMHRHPNQLNALKPENKSFSRSLEPWVWDKLSGQRHFQYLQDAVFRTYADLKRDAATSEGVTLLFHNPTDEESWIVAPQSFSLDRSSDKPHLYEYSIELLVLGPGDVVDQDFSEDASWLDEVKNTVQGVKNAIALISGAINDLTAIVAELSGLVKGIGSIFDEATRILTAATDFANGVTDLIGAPYTLVSSLQGAIDAATELMETDFSGNVMETIRKMQDGFDMLGQYPEAFEPTTAAIVKSTLAGQDLTLSASGGALADAEEREPPASVDAFDSLGTEMTPGEVEAAGGTITAGGNPPNYTGAQQHEITSGDTLVSLAAKFLGDARLWQQIAIVNGLKPPFLNSQAGSDLSDLIDSPLPGVAGVGKKLLIPNFSKPPVSQPLLPVLGVRREASAEEHFLGADLALVPTTGSSGRTTYDISVDADKGRVDAKVVRGIPNLTQALKTRLATEQGTDILYRKLGMARVVSLNSTDVDLELAKFRVLESLKADPRVSAVRKIKFGVSAETPDAVEMEASLEIRGFTQTSNVKSLLAT